MARAAPRWPCGWRKGLGRGDVPRREIAPHGPRRGGRTFASLTVVVVAIAAAVAAGLAVRWGFAPLRVGVGMLEAAAFDLAVLGGFALMRAGAARFRPGPPYPLREVLRELPTVALSLALVATAYTWIKLLLPAINPTLWDLGLGTLDRLICLGLDPNRFLLAIVEGNPAPLRLLLDAEYQSWFFLTVGGTAWLLTSPARDRRRAYLMAVLWLWLVGVLCYVLVPAQGPALVDVDLWRSVAAVTPNNAWLERELVRNYQSVAQIMAGHPVPVNIALGVAAMPSLHAAAQFLIFLFFRRNRVVAWFWGLTTGITCVGAVATGWHYAVDVLAGLLLAWLVYIATAAFSSGDEKRPTPARSL